MGPILLAFAAQAAASATVPASPPDIEISAQVRVRSLEIRQQGPIVVRLTAEPGATDSTTERSAPKGATTYRNLEIDARLAAWLTNPARTAETSITTGEAKQ